MLHLKKQKSKTGVNMNLHSTEGKIHEVFIGTKTLIGFLGFTIGGILVGRSMWEYGVTYIGLHFTTLVGIWLFAITGAALHKFNKK